MGNPVVEKIKAFDYKSLLDVDAMKDRVLSIVTGPRDLLGVDVGTYSVKFVHLTGGKRKPTLKAWGIVPLDLPEEADADLRAERLEQLITGFLKEKKVTRKQAATSVSGNAVIVRYVTLPKIDKSDMADILPGEAEPFIPIDINEVSLGCHVIQDVTEDGEAKMESVLVAVKNEAIDERVESLQGAGLLPVVIDVDAFTLEGLHEKMFPEAQEQAVLYLNVGNSVTNLSIIEGGLTRVVRDIFISGSTLTKAVGKTLGCDPGKAESVKHEKSALLSTEQKEAALAADDRDGLGVSVAVAEVLKDLVVEIQRSVEFYLSQNPERQVGKVVLCGGSVAIDGVPEFLEAQLHVPVERLHPLSFAAGSDAVPEKDRPALAVAAGLALRRVGDC